MDNLVRMKKKINPKIGVDNLYSHLDKNETNFNINNNMLAAQEKINQMHARECYDEKSNGQTDDLENPSIMTKTGSQPDLSKHSKQNEKEENINFSRNKEAEMKNTGEIAYPNANLDYITAHPDDAF